MPPRSCSKRDRERPGQGFQRLFSIILFQRRPKICRSSLLSMSGTGQFSGDDVADIVASTTSMFLHVSNKKPEQKPALGARCTSLPPASHWHSSIRATRLHEGNRFLPTPLSSIVPCKAGPWAACKCESSAGTLAAQLSFEAAVAPCYVFSKFFR